MDESGSSSIVDNQGFDRISNLPEALIHHILSFLDMRCVVQTCVLSKRWRYVWPSVSNLVFRGDAFGERGVKQLKKFRKFVDKVLMLRGLNDIHKFHLHWGNCRTDKIINEHLNAWVLVALRCNVQDLSIQIEGDGNRRYDLQLRFPESLFNSQSLSKLVLEMTCNYESQVILPESIDLPRLKFMSLSSFFVEDGGSMNKLISSCPILESLILSDIWIEDGYDMNVNIESHELKHLEIINNIDMLVWSHYNMAKIIKLSTPNLESFICKDYMLQEYCLENVSSLVTADIEIFKEGTYDAFENSELEISEEEKEILYPKRMMEFIKAFRNVQKMTVSSPEFLQVLAGAPDFIEGRFPQFCNLRCLQLTTWFTRRCLATVTTLLKSCPCVESLYLTSAKWNFIADKDDGAVELSVSCITPHLKRIEIIEVEGCDAEVKFLGLLLMITPVLEEMVLFLDTSSSAETAGSPDRLKLAKNLSVKLRSLPRASPSLAMIVFLQRRCIWKTWSETVEEV
ncbi:hypothetical protein MKW98_028490 [Papaver atlanticum]|uniref:F-box domain-containing protein n=1 Tax=Papaver atlanticum TaxID=357466 RepID=A0AAD4TGN5_9MAGN|nr:hypothetical protein MKW98_028490 [Papaver atlanticum]